MGELRLVDLALMVAPWLTSIKATEDQRMAAPLILTHMIDWGKKPPRQTPGRALTPEEQASIKRGVAAGAAAVGTGYIIYRVIRFLPSLAPPLWPTIPANAIIP